MNEEYLRRRFKKRILPALGDPVCSEGPVTVFLGGQPGAGKTRSQRLVKSMYGENLLPIIGDDYRQYHPQYAQLVREDPLRMPTVTASAAAAWTGMVVEWVDAHGASAVIEGTWRNSETVLKEAKRATQLGRRAHAVVVAVPPILSRLGILERYYFDLEQGESARWTPPEAHETAVHNLVSTVPAIAESGLFGRFTVIDREGAILYDGADGEAFSRTWAQNFARSLSEEERETVRRATGRLGRLCRTHTPENKEALAIIDGLSAAAV